MIGRSFNKDKFVVNVIRDIFIRFLSFRRYGRKICMSINGIIFVALSDLQWSTEENF